MKNKPLSDFEWTLLWMAVRYAMNGQTIATSMLPQEIMDNWYPRLSNMHKKQLVQEFVNNESDMKAMGLSPFGHPDIDRLGWMKFWKCLDEDCHFDLELNNGQNVKVFELDGKFYSIEKYIQEPFSDWYLNPDFIKLQS